MFSWGKLSQNSRRALSSFGYKKDKEKTAGNKSKTGSNHKFLNKYRKAIYSETNSLIRCKFSTIFCGEPEEVSI